MSTFVIFFIRFGKKEFLPFIFRNSSARISNMATEAEFIYCHKKIGPTFEACVKVNGKHFVFPVDARYRDRFRDDSAFHKWIERTAFALNSKETPNGTA